MFAAMLQFAVSGKDVGVKLLGVWVSILARLPICWAFGEPLSAGKDSGRR